MKRTPVRGVKENLKPYVYKQLEFYGYLLITTNNSVPFA